MSFTMNEKTKLMQTYHNSNQNEKHRSDRTILMTYDTYSPEKQSTEQKKFIQN